MAVQVRYEVNIRTPSGQYVTIVISALNETAAASAAQEMFGGGTVSYVKRIG